MRSGQRGERIRDWLAHQPFFALGVSMVSRLSWPAGIAALLLAVFVGGFAARAVGEDVARWTGVAEITPTPAEAGALAAETALEPEATPAPTPVPEPGPVRIVFWHAQADERSRSLLQQMADRFHREHPLISVEPVYVGGHGDVYKKALAAVQAGNPPDLAVAYDPHVAELMRAGAVAPLDPYASAPEIGLSAADKEDIFPGHWEASLYPEFGGQMLSFPFAMSAVAMYYNQSALRAAGIEEAPETWDEFEAACKAVSKGDVKGLAWRESATIFGAFLYSRGGKRLSDDQTRAVFNGPEGVAALELLARLNKAGHAWRPEGSQAEGAAFAAGKAVFVFGSTGDLAALAEAVESAGSTFEWGCANLPQKDPGKPRTLLGGASFFLLKTTEARQRAAWQFIKWFSEAGQTAEWGWQAGYAPIRRSAVQALAGAGYLEENPRLQQVYEAVIPYAYPMRGARGEEEIRRIIEDAWTAALADVEIAQGALDEAAANANAALAAKR